MSMDEKIPPDIAHGIALASAMVKAMLRDPDSNAVWVLHESIVNDIGRPLPDGTSEEIDAELYRRGLIAAGLVRAMAGAVVGIIQAHESRGGVANLELLDSSYDLVLDMEAE